MITHYFLRKKLGIIAIFLCLISISSFSQDMPPAGFNYQAVARYNDGSPVANQHIIVELNILRSSILIWQEAHSVTTNEFGLFSIVVGDGITTGAGLANSFKSINWTDGAYYLQVKVDFNNGLLDMGSVKLQSVPYALIADSAIRSSRFRLTELTDVDATGLSVGKIVKYNGSNWVMASDSGKVYKESTYISIGADDTIHLVTPMSGDLSGNYPNPTVVAIRNTPISATPPTSGQILEFNGALWRPVTNTSDTSLVAGNGIIFSNDTIMIDSVMSGDLSGNYPHPLVAGIQGSSVNIAGIGNGKIMKYNGSQWIMANDSGKTYIGSTYIDVSSGDVISLITPMSGDLSGNYPNPTVAGIRGSAVNVTGIAAGKIMKYDGTNWVMANDSGKIYQESDYISIGTGDTIKLVRPMSGDLLGDYPNPIVVGIYGSEIDTAGITASRILKYNGSQWVIAEDSGKIYRSSAYVSVGADDTLRLVRPMSGDLYGNYPSPRVTGLQGRMIDTTGIDVGKILKFNGTEWVMANDTGNTIYLGSHYIKVIDNVISLDSAVGGDLRGYYANPRVKGIQGRSIDTTGIDVGKILKFDGTEWAIANDSGKIYYGRHHINITGDSIVMDTVVSGDLRGYYPNPRVKGIQGRLIDTTGIALGKILKFDGTEWAIANDSGKIYYGRHHINITGDSIVMDTIVGGDLRGFYPNPRVRGIQGRLIDTTDIADGKILKFNGTEWVMASDTGSFYYAGNQLTLVNDTFRLDTIMSGDLRGIYPHPYLFMLQGDTIDLTGLAAGKVLKYNGEKWVIASDTGRIYFPGNQLSLDGDTLNLDTAVAGDLDGYYPHPTVIGLQGRSVSSNTPSEGDLLMWVEGVSDTAWVPYGVGGDVSGTYDNLKVTRIQNRLITSAAPADGNILRWSTSNNRFDYAAFKLDKIIDNDNDTKIEVEKTSDEDKIHFSTHGGERMTIDTSGLVGIGTTSPKSLFEVNGSTALKVSTVDITTDLDRTYSVVLVNNSTGTVTINLPAASTCTNRVYTIKYINTGGAVTIDPNGSETIDGAASVSISTQYKYKTIISDGSNWSIIGEN